jgi:hypothetical protein
MSDEHLARVNVTAFEPLDELRVVSVSRQPIDLSDLRAHRHVLAVDLELVGAVGEGAAARTRGLISHEQDRVVCIGQEALEIVKENGRTRRGSASR